MYQTYSLTTPTGAVDIAVVTSSRAHLSSLVGMPLFVKAVTPEGTFVVISRVVPLAVQTLESVGTRYTICSRLPRRVGLGIGLATPSQQSVVLNSIRTTTFLTFSALSATGMCRMFPASIAPLPLTTTMVNSKNPNKLIKNPTLPPGIQDSSQCVGEFPDSLNLLSRTSSRAGKRVHSRGRPQTHRIARRSSRSVSASSASRNPSPEALSSSSSGESEEESVGSDSKTPTVPRVITGKLSFKKLPSLKLPTAFPEGKAPTMSWDNQVAAEEGSSLVSVAENVPKSAQLL